MIITCENCETSFNLNEKLLKPKGSKVRCSRCKHMFTAYPPAPPEVEPSLVDTVPPEEIEEKPQDADVSESETTFDTSEAYAPEEPEDDLPPEDAGDLMKGMEEDADEEAFGDETGSDVAEETDAAQDDLDLEFGIDTVSEEEDAAGGAAGDDLDSLPEPPSGEPDVDLPEDPSVEAVSSADDVSLEDLDLDFDMASEDTAPAEEETLEDLGLDFEEATEDTASPEEDTLEDLDLDLDFDEATEETAPTEEDTLEDLDLDLDLDLEAATEETTPPDEEALEDLDLDLELDALPEDGATVEEASSSEDIDLSDIELSMAADSDAETPADEEDLDLELDLDLDSDLDTGAEPTEEEDNLESEELDFSDFEETVMLDSPPTPETEGISDDPGEELELDLDLDLEMEDEDLPAADAALSATDKEEVELEDLDFELDMELEGDAAEETADEDDEDVDLSDIEKMLEGGGEEFETVSLGPDIEDAETEVEKWKESPEDDELMDQTGEIDLSDIMIDVEDDEIEEDIEDVELDLDIDEASTPGGRQKPEDIDISGFEEFDIPEEGDQVKGDFSGGDIELEFEVDEDTDDLDGMATVSDFDEIGAGAETIAYSEPLVDVEEAPAKKKGKKKKVKKVRTGRKSSITRPILVLLILLILPLAAIVLLDKYMDINVPYVTDYLKQVPYLNQVMKSEMKTVGEIRVDNISSKFIDNAKLGKLFVITGTVKNEFPESRKYIRVRGSLFSTGKALAKDVTIYGGNVISDLDLAEMSLTEINKRLSNRFGDKKSNFDVKPGRAIPFMVVFSDLPESLEEFTIEAAGSFPVTTQ
jgi:pilus assembly protein FimV